MSYPQQHTVPAAPVPLWYPYYGAPIGEAARRFFKKYATFTGRASRSEYWWWALISGVVAIILNIIISAGATVSDSGAMVPGPGAVIGYILLGIWGLGTIIPSLALVVRRLHDVNFSGWMILIGLVPFLGSLALLIFMILPSKPEGQRFDVPA
ncbi:DUF805 domain-containing protein [Arthrobacter bambusae]|uniref:Uncharacterized membrane protein YhaH (DUF805 family) n=1 Tax=Arthrobacter bambusae TaxID=1338426 RepID=A0AAW8DH05_9MICC|nr:DUF805 domain-containing protein [Arthrobacter bambusae]MDP9905625.1 uncharacterized membrane protein YhaH (DUF805 family) [Arthrobacter bambusae]MDQ0127293.1 uncharacterized membrane protein YhaH (DUF805 family) [Arthrobacter bambusae]MDQ0178635.1 uncharacterized membrane protein YhaH (DUF805 family) [Arthrobacter bambusae]